MLGGALSTQARPLVSRLNVVYLYVRELERSLAFYRDLLGIPLQGDGNWAQAQLGSTRFALHLAHEGVDDLGSGTVHLDFEVASIDEAVERVRAAGVEVHETMRDEWGAAANVVDPDGYRIALFEPPQ